MLQVNVKQARFNMIQQQIRPWEVLEQRVLDVMSDIPREHFVSADYRNLAFADINIPLAHDQVMMNPKVEGRLLQALMLTSTDTVLEIGTGSAYMTALLAKLAKHVESVDIFEDFIIEAATKLNALNIQNVSLKTGDAINGWNATVHYDVIILTGAVPSLIDQYQSQLNDGGRLLAIVGETAAMQVQLIRRVGEYFEKDVLFETSLPCLLGAATSERFIF